MKARKCAWFLVLCLVLPFSLMAGGKTESATGSGVSTGYIEGTFPAIKAGKPYKGVTLVIPTVQGWGSFKPAVDMTPEFEEMTGIKIQYQFVPFDGMVEKVLLEMSQHTKVYDIIQTYGEVFALYFNYTIPLDEMIKKDWGSIGKFEDWFFPCNKGLKTTAGEYKWVPFHANTQIGYYRKALFENPEEQKNFKAKYGYDLAPPTTIKQLEDIATFFTRPKDGLYGFTANWGVGQGWGGFNHYYMASGFDLVDENNKSTMKTDPGRSSAIKIATWMQDAVYKNKFTNPDSVNFLTGQVSDYFFSGASALAFGWLSDYWTYIQENPTDAGPIGAFAFPTFSGKNEGGYASWWVAGISADSKNPEAAWEYIKWTLNEKVQKAMAGGQLPPIKDLAYKVAVDPGGLQSKALYDAFVNARVPYKVPELSEVRAVSTDAFQSMISNMMSPEEYVDIYANEVERIMKKYGYVK